MKPIIEILELIIQDLSENYKDYDQSKLLKIFGQFQNQILNLKRSDIELITNLNELSLNQILECQKKLGLELLSAPTLKSKLIPLISGLILQKKKKKEFLEIVQSLKTLKKKPTLKTPKNISIPSDYEDLRKLWLTNKSLSQLETDLKKINMNKIRVIVKPWDLKPIDRTKTSLINAVIDYIRKMKNVSKLGT